MGAHQKIDRVARKHLARFLHDNDDFPRIRQILHFEGKNGPDAIKRKSPAKDEPWHYYDPFDENDGQIIDIIEGHYNQLVEELRRGNNERASFEAAWLAHALVDGMTPAHHFPYEERLVELRGGESIAGRTTVIKKLIMPGTSPTTMIKNNWKMWGSKGLMTTHGTFELGIASIIAPLPFNEARPSKIDVELAQNIGLVELFKRTAHEIALMNLYNTYYLKGWTPLLASNIRTKLTPMIIRTVTLAWYLAAKEAGKL
jgi:hypothetical protein